MKLSEFTEPALADRLAGPGIYLHSGPFVFHLRSALRQLPGGLRSLYADHQVELETDFADFHIRLDRAAGIRGWLRPEVDFYVDSFRPYLAVPLDSALALLEWGINWCMSNHAHQYVIVHCAVLARDDHAVILPAPPESGKSTLCAAMACEGWRLLSDELALVDPDALTVTPIVRPIGLKNDSIEIVRSRYPTATLGPVSPRTPKGRVAHLRPPAASVEASQTVAEPRWVVFPKYTPGAALSLTPKPRSRAFMQLVSNTNNYHHLGASAFATLVGVIEGAECFDLSFSSLDEALGAVSDVTGA